MKPYDRLTIIRNRHRVRDLRIFRARVRAYFEQYEYDVEGLPVDVESIRAARAEIHRMLPRVVQIVEAADLGASSVGAMRSPANRAVEILHDIFSARYADGAYQEVLDVLDMAIGVYDASRYGALVRTVNPFHYLATALGFVAGLPRRALVAMGLVRSRSSRRQPTDMTPLDAALSRLASTEALIDRRFSELREWQSRLFAEHASHLTDLAERMDFMERVLAQRGSVRPLKPGEKRANTPV